MYLKQLDLPGASVTRGPDNQIKNENEKMLYINLF
jgi:hypothetical protein